MVEGAGVQPDPAGLRPPGLGKRRRHHAGPQALAGRCGHETEEADLDILGDPAVEFDDADLAGWALRHEKRVVGMVEDGGKIRIGHHQTRGPQPVEADGRVEAAIPGKVGRRDRPEPQPLCRRAGRRLAHLQIGHHRSDLAGGQVRIAIKIQGDRGGAHGGCVLLALDAAATAGHGRADLYTEGDVA
jgi:hypothetical protein